MNFLKNILLLIVVVVLSYFSAEYLGAWYDSMYPSPDSIFLSGAGIAYLVNGFIFAYIFFTNLLFSLFGFGKKNIWLIVLLIPPALLWIFGDITHIYLPIILGLIGWGLAVILRKVFKLDKSQDSIVR